ncbi:MAG: four helix bundle protein [Bacteroidetes bacterium]|nr:four helix bundle protein [Bacteroidota bacterium]
MNRCNMKERTFQFAVEIIRFCSIITKNELTQILCRQLIRCSTSVGANYRAASRSKSVADYIHKLKIVEEECDEVQYFIELIQSLEIMPKHKTNPLISECDEIIAIVISMIKKARLNRII